MNLFLIMKLILGTLGRKNYYRNPNDIGQYNFEFLIYFILIIIYLYIQIFFIKSL